MSFELIDEEIWTITKYLSPEELTEEELEILGDYTQGQWSDGIGEGFEQNPIMEYEGEEVYLSHGIVVKILNSNKKKLMKKSLPKKHIHHHHYQIYHNY